MTLERRVCARYLAMLLTGEGAAELGDGRKVVSVGFQQSPRVPDDLVIFAARSDEPEPSLELAVAVRRAPDMVPSSEKTRKLIKDFARAVTASAGGGREQLLALVVAGPQTHAQQVGKLAGLAASQMSASGFFALVRTPGKFDKDLVERLGFVEQLVTAALKELDGAEPDPGVVQLRTWQVLSRLAVLMPRVEDPDASDWVETRNRLTAVARGNDLAGAGNLLDRLESLAGQYGPRGGQVDLKILGRDVHRLLEPGAWGHRQAWTKLRHLEAQAAGAVRDCIGMGGPGQTFRLDRQAEVDALVSTAAGGSSVVVCGESGVGKSLLALQAARAAADAVSGELEALFLNLRHLPEQSLTLVADLGCPLEVLLGEMSAPKRLLVVDAADAAAEDRREMFTYLLRAARESEVTVVAVTAAESQQVVHDLLVEHGRGDAIAFPVRHLDDCQLAEILAHFPELSRLVDSPRSRELLRRLVLVDLLVRSRVSDVPLSDLDAMRQVWDGLVRRHGARDRGLPDARAQVLLNLAAQALSSGSATDGLDAAALDGLRRDGLLRDSAERPWQVLPEFAHDEVRRYALARVLLANGDPAADLLAAGAPRWALSAGRLACQAMLDAADSSGAPLRGGMTRIQAAFDELVARGHGARWGDVPAEAVLTLSDPAPVLAEAWSDLRDGQALGLRRLLRVIGQRHRDAHHVVDPLIVEPVVALLLNEAMPWEAGKDEAKALREWLVALILRGAPAGQDLRVRLRQRLVDACAEGQERLVEQQRVRAAERAARTPEQIEAEREFEARRRPALLASGRGPRRRPAELSDELTDAVVLELLALLGPDLDEAGAQLLRQVAQDRPWYLAPAVEELCTGPALARYGHGLLAELTQAYYLDEEADGTGFHENGIRSHHSRGPVTPLSSRYHGPFLALFHTDPRAGIAVVNQMLNHAARARARTLAQAGAPWSQVPADAVEQRTTELDVTGTPRRYVGDDHVWRWYRGTGVGPYPCMSALQALEYWCDLRLAAGTRLDVLVTLLLDGCENLAMLGLVVGLLVRHLEQAGTLLDPFLAQPILWALEAARASAESRPLAAGSDDVTAPERRRWSLREAATHLTVHADAARADQLRSVADQLVAAAEAEDAALAAEGSQATDETTHVPAYATQARNWASALDSATYRAHTQDGMTYIASVAPADVQEALRTVREELQRGTEAMRLLSRYVIEARTPTSTPVPPTAQELAADLQAAQDLLNNPPASSPVDPWDAAAAVAAAALHEHLAHGTGLSQDTAESAARTVLAIADGAAPPRPFEFEDTYFEQGCDRSAARVLPLLLLPSAATLRDACATGTDGEDRVLQAGRRLAQAPAAETRLHLARGLDPVWQEPCRPSPCHHQQALDLVLETMRACLLGPWDPARQQRSTVLVGEPVPQFLAHSAAEDIYVSRLDAALRGYGAAAAGNSCVREQARELLLAVLDAHRRALLHEPGYDSRGHHTLAAARALLQLATAGDDQPLHDHATAYADNDTLLEQFLTALAAVAEEAPAPARTARRVWPDLMTKMLGLRDAGRSTACFDSAVLAALIPTPVYEGRFMYRELESAPLPWTDALAWRQEIEAWLPDAAGDPLCVSSLLGLIETLPLTDQVSAGLPWVTTLVLTDGKALIRPRLSLARWLVNIRSTAADLNRQNGWQELVDALVVAGDLTLAPYSE